VSLKRSKGKIQACKHVKQALAALALVAFTVIMAIIAHVPSPLLVLHPRFVSSNNKDTAKTVSEHAKAADIIAILYYYILSATTSSLSTPPYPALTTPQHHNKLVESPAHPPATHHPSTTHHLSLLPVYASGL
jgi:hypothetical protein